MNDSHSLYLRPINDELYFLQRPIVVTTEDETCTDVLMGFSTSYGGYKTNQQKQNKSSKTNELPPLSSASSSSSSTQGSAESLCDTNHQTTTASPNRPKRVIPLVTSSESSAFVQYSVYTNGNL